MVEESDSHPIQRSTFTADTLESTFNYRMQVVWSEKKGQTPITREEWDQRGGAISRDQLEEEIQQDRQFGSYSNGSH